MSRQQIEERRDRVEELYGKGHTQADIAEVLDVGVGTVCRDLAARGVQADRSTRRRRQKPPSGLRRGADQARPAPPAVHLTAAPPAARAAFGRLLARLAPHLAHASEAELAALGNVIASLAEAQPDTAAEARQITARHLDPEAFRAWLNASSEDAHGQGHHP